jgi:uncharacterized protein
LHNKPIRFAPGFLLFLSGCSAKVAPITQGVQLSPASLAVVQVITAAVMSAGLVSLFTFVIPGLTIIWLAALVYGLLTGFTVFSSFCFVLITILMIFGNMADELLMGAKAKQSGASWTSVILSTIAAFVFSLIWPPFGGIIAAMLVLFVFEFIRLRDLRKAGGSTKEMAVGCVSATFARFFIGLVMISIWVAWVWQSGKSPFWQ